MYLRVLTDSHNFQRFGIFMQVRKPLILQCEMIGQFLDGWHEQ